MKRIDVPAALMSMTSGMSRSASMITSVSSQSLRLSGRICAPISALMMSERLDMLFEAGSFTVSLRFLGLVTLYVFIGGDKVTNFLRKSEHLPVL